MSNNQALSTRGSVYPLYDSQELLNMDSKVAGGYAVLMGVGGGLTVTTSDNKKRKSNEEVAAPKMAKGAVNLAFLALTEGNVVDACFGVKAHMSAQSATRQTDRAAKMANDAKSFLTDAVRSSDAVREIAVVAYGKAFDVVMEYNKDVKSLNFFTRCYRWKPLTQRAEKRLAEAFRPLNEAIDAAN